jgi:hypothetical protein
MNTGTMQEPEPERPTGQTPEQAARLRAIIEKARATPRLTMAEYMARRREEAARRARGERGPTPEQQERLLAIMAAQGKKPGDCTFEKIMAKIESRPPLWASDEEYLAFMASIGRPQKPEDAS